jgi:hypothetical protein
MSWYDESQSSWPSLNHFVEDRMSKEATDTVSAVCLSTVQQYSTYRYE